LYMYFLDCKMAKLNTKNKRFQIYMYRDQYCRAISSQGTPWVTISVSLEFQVWNLCPIILAVYRFFARTFAMWPTIGIRPDVSVLIRL
jgi:hypothetical protein